MLPLVLWGRAGADCRRVKNACTKRHTEIFSQVESHQICCFYVITRGFLKVKVNYTVLISVTDKERWMSFPYLWERASEGHRNGRRRRSKKVCPLRGTYQNTHSLRYIPVPREPTEHLCLTSHFSFRTEDGEGDDGQGISLCHKSAFLFSAEKMNFLQELSLLGIDFFVPLMSTLLWGRIVSPYIHSSVICLIIIFF